jgi:hypothetical protein
MSIHKRLERLEVLAREPGKAEHPRTGLSSQTVAANQRCELDSEDLRSLAVARYCLFTAPTS